MTRVAFFSVALVLTPWALGFVSSPVMATGDTCARLHPTLNTACLGMARLDELILHGNVFQGGGDCRIPTKSPRSH
jgi:hypothetical protein